MLILLLLAGASYVGIQLGMPYYRNASFEERVGESMPFLRGQTVDFIRKIVIETAREFDLDLEPEQVQVKIQSSLIIIDIQYEKTVEFPFWNRTIIFRPHFEGPYN